MEKTKEKIKLTKQQLIGQIEYSKEQINKYMGMIELCHNLLRDCDLPDEVKKESKEKKEK